MNDTPQTAVENTKPAAPKMTAVEKAQAALAKAQAAVEKAAAAEANSAFNKLFTAWADAKGHSNAKGNRRASNMALIAEWEEDMKNGVIEGLEKNLGTAEA